MCGLSLSPASPRRGVVGSKRSSSPPSQLGQRLGHALVLPLNRGKEGPGRRPRRCGGREPKCQVLSEQLSGLSLKSALVCTKLIGKTASQRGDGRLLFHSLLGKGFMRENNTFFVICLFLLQLFVTSTNGHAFNQAHIARLSAEGACPRCDLSYARLLYSKLAGANLSGADLTAANLSSADLTGANLYGSGLSGAILSGSNLSGANLSHASASGATLSRANLAGANLSGADLSRTNLSEANLTGANLSDASLANADLSATNLSGAYLSGTIWLDGVTRCAYDSIGECQSWQGKTGGW